MADFDHIKAMDGEPQSDDTYNGWSNYPTWAVNLWLSNDRGLYEATQEIVGEVLVATEPTSEFWTLEESHRFNLADRLKDWVRDELATDLADLLGWAFDHVNWEEIAASWIEESAAVL